VTDTAIPGPAPTALASPYKGLTYYSEHDAAYFFGRESETEIIIANLMASRLTLLYGESGVGKSSVLHAGAMRRLHEIARENIADFGRPEFVAVSFRSWQNDPIAGLREAIRSAVGDLLPDTEPVERNERLDQELFEWCDRVDGDLIIVLDQFEEYFLYHANEGAPGTFFVEFPRLLNRGDLRVNFLIGIREDGLAKLDAFKGRVPNLFDNYLRIDHLSLKAAHAAIERPIERWNELHPAETDVAVEEGLIEAVLDQVRAGQFFIGTGGAGTAVESKNGKGNVIETPFLQLVMTRLWEEELGAGSQVLRRETLERLGGAERIVRTHLDRVMGSLPADEQDLAADIFRQLVTPSGTKIAHALPDLAEYAERPESDLLPVIDHLSSSDIRVLRPVAPPPDQPGGLRYEIFHDVLAAAILDWRARWVQAERERELAASLEEQERERKLAEEQAARERRRARTFRAVAGIALVAAAVAALLGVWAFRQKDRAERQRATARSQELAAESTTQLGLEPRLSLALALAAMDEKPTAQAEQALRVALSEARVRVLLRGHANWVNTARFSPDGRLLLTGSDDKTARIWDAQTGTLRKVLRGQSGLVNWADWSGDGTRVVTGGDTTARIWRWRTSAPPRILRVGSTVVSATFGGPRGEYVATASFDDMARIFNARTGKLLWKQAVPNLHTARFDSSGLRLVTASVLPDDRARVYEWQNPKSKPVVVNAKDPDLGRQPQTDAINAVVFSADGTKIATASEDKSVAVWSARTGEKLSQVYGPKDAVLGIAMSPNGRFVAGASRDGAIYLWDWQGENRIARILGHTDLVSDVSFSPDGRTLASASGDRTARLWAMPPLQTLPHTQPVTWASWSPDGKLVATATNHCESGLCYGHIWNPKTGETIHDLVKHTDWLTGTAFSRDGRYVATSSDDQTARVWSVQSGKQVSLLKGHDDWVESVDFNPDGRLLLSSSLDGTARIWNWRTRKTVATLHEPGDEILERASFSPDGRYVLTTSGSPHDYTARVWDWRRSATKAVRVLKGHTGAVNGGSWSRDGRYVVTASSDRTARVWNWRQGVNMAVLSGQSGTLKDASFSPDGRYVATSSADGSARIWDWRAANALTQIKWHLDLVHSIEFSPDGSKVLTSSDDWSADISPCETCGSIESLILTARQRVQRSVTPDELDVLLRKK
jgi:WD40 repeat protein